MGPIGGWAHKGMDPKGDGDGPIGGWTQRGMGMGP